jgi:NAD(P)-dependent dehydrogenase (short-subunit alcohol dehydrogenase family)
MAYMISKWTLAQMPSQAGKRFFITGANSGVGYAAAVELARRGATVVLGCRDRAKGEDALKRLAADAAGPESAAAKAELVMLDLASLASVREVAAAEVARHQPLHCLINNAGIMRPPKRRETKDGFEAQFGTNVLGHFALTCQLMPALEMARAARVEDAPRVVTLSSLAHKMGRINFDDLQSSRRYNPTLAYAQSKLADLLFAFELERRLRAGSFGAVSIAVHPGVARSKLFKVGSSTGLARLPEQIVQAGIGLLLNSALGGAIPTLFAATSPQAQGGHYYGPQGFQELRGGDVGPAYLSPAAKDAEAQRKLWEVCAELTGCDL